MEFYTVKVTSKGQITIPKELRDQFHILEGETAVLIPVTEGILLKHELNPMRKLRGIMRHEIELERASQFIREMRREWRLE
ncbi:MAG: SpoVT / AbrB like domain protein [Candidatus Bathyarchaeota archaeon BA1]|nr:MAG: SpoVT / AbrB like domain protein [Candidatus Bathyarchaeota archaeon BA1]